MSPRFDEYRLAFNDRAGEILAKYGADPSVVEEDSVVVHHEGRITGEIQVHITPAEVEYIVDGKPLRDGVTERILAAAGPGARGMAESVLEARSQVFVSFPVAYPEDPELEALEVTVAALAKVDSVVAVRVAEYLLARFGTIA